MEVGGSRRTWGEPCRHRENMQTNHKPQRNVLTRIQTQDLLAVRRQCNTLSGIAMQNNSPPTVISRWRKIKQNVLCCLVVFHSSVGIYSKMLQCGTTMLQHGLSSHVHPGHVANDLFRRVYGQQLQEFLFGRNQGCVRSVAQKTFQAGCSFLHTSRYP